MKKPSTKLTPKETKFVKEYLIDLNATAAAIRAGYSEKTASQIGYQKLQKNSVQEAITVAQKELSVKSGITPEKVIEGFRQIAEADIADCYDENGNLKNIHDIPKATRMALAGLDVFEEFEGRGENREQIGFTKKIKLWDKLKALDSLAKHFGLYNADQSQKPKAILFHIIYEDKPESGEDGQSGDN